MAPPSFPVDLVLPTLRSALGERSCAVLSAAPGAGKTTRVPPALLDEPWLAGLRILLLEPRRIAALRAAEYISAQMGERVGGRVGYRIRGETCVSGATGLEILTEGVLTRMLHTDPSLSGVGLVIFDEFHERSIHADLGLALTLDVKRHLRPDLRVLVMSATLDTAAVAHLLDDAPVVSAPGRVFPVETRYIGGDMEGPLESAVAKAVRGALKENEGDILVFLPGQREIHRVESLLAGSPFPDSTIVCPLFGEATPQVYRAALEPAPGSRKVILSTSVAETSLTIEGVRVVIDSGLARVARFDPRRGMSGLVTGPVSRAVADQRRGRAGRVAPGVCYRLWTERRHEGLAEFPVPEILTTDLAPLALDMARWGSGEGLKFLDPPPEAHLRQARALLTNLGALDATGRLTPHGERMSTLPVHPRLAHMLLRAADLGLGPTACDIAALLEERDILRGRATADIDIRSRLHALREGGDPGTRARIMRESQRLRNLLGLQGGSTGDEGSGLLLALAYPERVARRRDARGRRYATVGGAGAVLPEGSVLGREEFLALGDVDGAGTEVRVFLAGPLTKEDVARVMEGGLAIEEEVRWDERQEAVSARRVTKAGALVVDEEPIPPDDVRVLAAMMTGIRALGLGSLPWSPGAQSMRERSQWLRRTGVVGSDWPDLGDATLLTTLEVWLGPFVQGMTRRKHLDGLDMDTILRSMFTHRQQADLDRFAPSTLTVPTGSRIRLDYSTGDGPVLAVKLQEMFGQVDTPRIAGGRVPVLIQLLSPAGRPLAITQDLPSFWANAYPEVRKQMRGRYPKHPWPEDPLSAIPTRSTRRSGRPG